MLRGRLHITQSIFGNFSSPAPPDRRVRNSKPSSADYVILAGTRQTFKTGVKTFKGRISFLLQSLPVKIIITYLIRVFDTTWESTFWALKFLFLGQFFIFSC